jgi:integrase
MQTVYDVYAAVRTTDLPERRKQDILAALNTAARALGKPPDRILAEPRRLLAQLQQVSPQPLGVSPRRWANILSLVRAALAQTHAISTGRSIQRLSESWSTLYRQLDRWQKLKLSRFLRFCSARDIEPAMVTEATFAAFAAYVDDALLWNPDKIYAAVIDGWGKAQAAVPDWPRLQITRPDRRHRWTLPWSSFPSSLQQECNVYLDRLRGDDPLEEAAFRPVRASTIKSREWLIRGFASALVLSGQDPTTISSLRDLVEIETFKKGLRYLIERSGGKATTAVRDFAWALKVIARHHLNLEPLHLDKMTRIIRRLDVGSPGLTEKNRTRLRQLEDPQQASALLRLPLDLIEIAARNQKPHAGALQAQAAVAIEILLMAPLRLDNLARLDLEQNLVRPGRGPGMHIVIERENVKNGESLDYPLPPPSVTLIERYLAEFRPRLASSRCTALFPGRGDGPKSPNALREQITKTVHRHTGMQMNPHLFRHATAKLYLDANRGDYETVRRVLAHRSITTTTTFYTGLETGPAVRHFDETILKQRKDANAI